MAAEPELNEHFINMMKELQRMFRLLNDKYYEGALVEPIIAIQTNQRINSRVMGWYQKDCWRNMEKGEPSCEITLCGEYLNRDPKEIVATLLHEMVHLYNAMLGIKDTSRKGFYHNKRFKFAALEHGLLVGKADKEGLHVTTLNEESDEFITDNLDRTPFILARISSKTDEDEDEDDEKKKKKKKRVRPKYVYTCEKCGYSFKLKTERNLVCGDCYKAFTRELEDIDEDEDEEDEEA